MEYIRGGNYYSLRDIAEKVGVTRMAIKFHADHLQIKPIKLGRLFTRYHEDDMKKIVESFK